MLNRFLGIDNCIGCSKLLKLPDEVMCLKYKKKLELTCFSIPIKLEYCNKPFKYDSKASNSSNGKIVD
jgi:hypothetical protein